MSVAKIELTNRERQLYPKNEKEAEAIDRYGEHIGAEYYRLAYEGLDQAAQPARIAAFTRAIMSGVDHGRITLADGLAIVISAMEERGRQRQSRT